MKSTDSRFKNAEDDIWQHTINNEDWDTYWVFDDSRFKLGVGFDDDEIENLLYIFRRVCS